VVIGRIFFRVASGCESENALNFSGSDKNVGYYVTEL
jgi:hypothetical protein